jgi:hypothetical protein
MGKLLRLQTQLSFTSVDEIYANNSVCVHDWRMTLIFSVPFGSDSFESSRHFDVQNSTQCVTFFKQFLRAFSPNTGHCQA